MKPIELFSKIKIKATDIKDATTYLDNHLSNVVDFNDFPIKDIEPMFFQNTDMNNESSLREDEITNIDQKYLFDNASNNDGSNVVIKGGLNDV